MPEVDLRGCIDTHVHTFPDLRPRTHTDIECVSEARAAGLAGVVLKNHFESTVSRAAIASAAVPDIAVLGGLPLNEPTCGGFNPAAVAAALKLGARVIWMPTFSARNYKTKQTATSDAELGEFSQFDLTPGGLSPLSLTGVVLDSVLKIIDMIAEHDAVLATGHLSSTESAALLAKAHERGARRLLVTHPEASKICMDVSTQRDLSRLGVRFERCFVHIRYRANYQQIVSDIRAVGIEHTVLATDFGRVGLSSPVEGFRSFGAELMDAGLTEAEWQQVASANAADLFDLARPAG